MSLQGKSSAASPARIKRKVMTITAVTGFAVNSSLPRARISKQRKSSATEGNLYKRINNFNYCDSSGAENKTLAWRVLRAKARFFRSRSWLFRQLLPHFSRTDEKPCTKFGAKQFSRLSWFISFLLGWKSVLLCIENFFTNERLKCGLSGGEEIASSAMVNLHNDSEATPAAK
jgi:hypothetical protein